MEMSELGIEVAKIEENLARIFRRVTRWKAILLMDEADIFLAQRDTDLARSVIVGIFLRLMDYYKGLLFLTSNRADVIDDAFKSRITIRINYPLLTEESRQEIWRNLLQAAQIRIVDDDPEAPLDRPFVERLATVELNGRQIRNLVRLIRVLHGNTVRLSDAINVCQFACR
jgi:ATPases of the AAA+ class